jgi:hypothetical protein
MGVPSSTDDGGALEGRRLHETDARERVRLLEIPKCVEVGRRPLRESRGGGTEEAIVLDAACSRRGPRPRRRLIPLRGAGSPEPRRARACSGSARTRGLRSPTPSVRTSARAASFLERPVSITTIAWSTCQSSGRASGWRRIGGASIRRKSRSSANQRKRSRAIGVFRVPASSSRPPPGTSRRSCPCPRRTPRARSTSPARTSERPGFGSRRERRERRRGGLGFDEDHACMEVSGKAHRGAERDRRRALVLAGSGEEDPTQALRPP